jgi:small-conductance mechanosensitive channel
MTQYTREEKAKIFNSLLLENDKLSMQISSIQSKIDLSSDDEKKIKELKQKMFEIQKKVEKLGW